MSDLEDVIRLLERWRDATGMARLRIGVDAGRVIAALPPARKRALAVEVAERVAPQLVPAIRADDGDLSAEQVGALVDLLKRADQQQLDDLVAALRTGDVGAAVGIVDDAIDVVAPPSVAEPASPTDDAEPDAEAPGASDPLVDGEVIALAAAAVEADTEVEVGADGSLELDEEAVRARLVQEAAARADRYRDTTRDVPSTPSYRAPVLDFTTDLDLPDPTVPSAGSGAASVPRPLRSRGTAAGLGMQPVAAVVAAITATPDGYRRRRAALTAIREERLDAGDLATVVRSFSRATDRSWVAGAAVDAGLVGTDALPGLGLTPAAEARLRRRVS